MGYKNKERRNANISAIIMMIGIAGVVLPYVLDANMMGWGFGVSFVGIFVALSACFVFLMFRGRAKVLDRMFKNENVLARWQYSKEFWGKEYEEDMEDSGIAKVAGFFLGGIFLMIGIVVYMVNPDDNGMFLIIMLAIAVFFAIVGFAATAAEKKRITTSMPEAVISKQGLFYKNILYTWNNRLISYLVSVGISPVDHSKIIFTLRQLSRSSGSFIHFYKSTLEIPIPPGQEQSASEIVKYFNLPLDKEDFEELDS
jgi:hypothetical protein